MQFKLGQVVATQGIVDELTQDDIDNALNRYINCDWGNLDEEDWQANDEAVRNNDRRILASYRSSKGIEFWCITEWDRSVTTLLLPSEY